MKEEIIKLLQQPNLRFEHEQSENGFIRQYISTFSASRLADQLIDLYKEQHQRWVQAQEEKNVVIQ